MEIFLAVQICMMKRGRGNFNALLTFMNRYTLSLLLKP